MSDLIHNLGIDWRLLIANTVTFFIVLWILRKFAYGPIMRALDQRQSKIAAGLDAAKEQTHARDAFEQEKVKLLQAAKHSAQALMHDAETQAANIRQQEIEKTQADVAQLVAKSRIQLEREREQMLKHAKKDLAELVVQATEKVLQGTVDDGLDKKIRAQAMKAVK